MSKIQLGVMFGSRSCEHEVSIISAVQLMRAADRQTYDVIPIYISKKGEWFTGDPLFDIATYTPFDENRKGIRPGAAGSDGRFAGVDYPGAGKGSVCQGTAGDRRPAGLQSSRCSMDFMERTAPCRAFGLCTFLRLIRGRCLRRRHGKVYMKLFFQGCGFPVLRAAGSCGPIWEKNPEEVMNDIEKNLPYPVFVKPASLGSSIGVTRANDRASLKEALELAFEFDRKTLVEKGLCEPLELNCSVLGYDGEAEASEIEMPISGGDLLTFMDKYGSNSTKGMASLKRVLPAPIEPELKERIQKLSVDIFKAMDCKGVVRIDYMFDAPSQELYITEINTIPGSLAFYLWEACGLPYAKLIDRMVECAMKAEQDKEENNYAYTSDILKNISMGGKTGMKNGLKNA